MEIYSIALTNLFASSHVEPIVVDHVAAVVDVNVGSTVAIGAGAVGAKDVAKVEGTTMVTFGMIVVGASSRLACFSCIKPSSSFSISFN